MIPPQYQTSINIIYCLSLKENQTATEMAESTKKSTVYIFKHKIKLEKRLNVVSDNKLFLEGSRFESVAFCVDFVDPVLVWFLSGCSGFLPQCKYMLIRLTGDSELAIWSGNHLCSRGDAYLNSLSQRDSLRY